MMIAGGLAAASAAAFIAGVVLIGVGIAWSSKGGSAGLFAASGSGPEKTGFEDGHPVGLYFMTRFWSGTGSLEKAVWYFTSDGRVYRDLEDGFSDDVLARHEGPHGTVSRDGDTMVVTWSDGKRTRSDVERDGDSFTWDMGIFTPVKGFDDDSDLAGKWEGGNSVSFGGGSSSATRALELREDGTFSQSSVASISSRSERSRVSAGAQGAASGTWKLDGYTLTLTREDGTAERGVAFPYDDGTGTRRFYFAGVMYKKL